jgi:hypothetical protein
MAETPHKTLLKHVVCAAFKASHTQYDTARRGKMGLLVLGTRR